MNSDDAMMQLVASGDHATFESLYNRWNERILKYLLWMNVCRQDADNMSQEVWLRVYSKCRDYEGRGLFWFWIKRIAKGIFIDSVRKTRESVCQSCSDDDGVSLVDRYLASTGDSLDRMIYDEESEKVSSVLQDIPALQAEVFSLYVFGGMSFPEIAEMLSVPVPTVKSRCRLAKEKIRERLGICQPKIELEISKSQSRQMVMF